MTDDKEIVNEELPQETLENTDLDKQKPKKEKKDKIKELELELKEVTDKFLRERAELENFKKRMIQERITDRKYANIDLISELLVPLDQLDKIVSMETENELLKNFLVGFKMINDLIFQTLETAGLKKIDALGLQFDPKYHHAIEKVSDLSKANGEVIMETQKGYMYKERIIRPAMVKVNEWGELNGENK